MDLHREFYPERRHLEPSTILWATTKAGEGAKVNWGKRTEEYGIQMVRLLESAAEQGGLLSGAELPVLMNRSLSKVHDCVRTYEEETGEALPLKGYVLDMGSSPTHKGIICRKFEEGMSPPDIARATGHSLGSMDNYLGVYDRIKVLLRKGLDVPTICQVTGSAPRTVAQYMVIVEHFHPELLDTTHRDWLKARRRKRNCEAKLPAEAMAPMVESLKGSATLKTRQGETGTPGRSGEAGRKPRGVRNEEPSGRGAETAGNHSPDICPRSK